MLNEYHPPEACELSKLQEAEDLYCQVEAFIRNTLPSGMPREQALFRLRESEMWTKEGIKSPGLSEPEPRNTR
jgi:hypothetical protein